MKQPRPAHITARARRRRRTMTPEEHRLWWYLRDRLSAVKWRRQEPIGPFIADFASYSHRLVIEADGSHHIDNPRDETRDRYLTAAGWHVMRIANTDITRHINDVLAHINDALENQHRKTHVRCRGQCRE